MISNIINQNKIDCSKDPVVPDGYKLLKHHKGGVLHWDPVAYSKLFVLEEQKDGKGIEGHRLLQILQEKISFLPNANVLSHVLSYPFPIPAEWLGKKVLFPGTTLVNAYGQPCISFFDGRNGSGYGVKKLILPFDQTFFIPSV
jgi:hypothetical protein